MSAVKGGGRKKCFSTTSPTRILYVSLGSDGVEQQFFSDLQILKLTDLHPLELQ